jgi:hypothetical protein
VDSRCDRDKPQARGDWWSGTWRPACSAATTSAESEAGPEYYFFSVGGGGGFRVRVGSGSRDWSSHATHCDAICCCTERRALRSEGEGPPPQRKCEMRERFFFVCLKEAKNLVMAVLITRLAPS